MKKPCNNCPFIRGNFQDLPRAPSIADEIRAGSSFSCHKTTRETGTGEEEHCYGAAKVLLNEAGHPGQMLRIEHRLGIINLNEVENMELDAFDDFEEWIEAMT